MLTNLLLLTSLFVGPALACCDSRAANTYPEGHSRLEAGHHLVLKSYT